MRPSGWPADVLVPPRHICIGALPGYPWFELPFTLADAGLEELVANLRNRGLRHACRITDRNAFSIGNARRRAPRAVVAPECENGGKRADSQHAFQRLLS